MSDADFLARPFGSRAGALLARQSAVLDSDDVLEAAMAEQRRRIEHDPTLLSSAWAVYAVRPTAIEFWQAREDRKHTRLRYSRVSEATDWNRHRLWP